MYRGTFVAANSEIYALLEEAERKGGTEGAKLKKQADEIFDRCQAEFNKWWANHTHLINWKIGDSCK